MRSTTTENDLECQRSYTKKHKSQRDLGIEENDVKQKLFKSLEMFGRLINIFE